jgi:hypothetical protein
MDVELTPKKFGGWFFDIYIQGSKKSTTLRAESEIYL